MSKTTSYLIIALCLLLSVTQLMGIDYFYYERHLLMQGQYWRLLTAHFVHLNLIHLVLNLAGLTLVLIILGQVFSLKEWLFLIVCSASLQSIGFYCFLPDVNAYVGFSGVIHSLYVADSLSLLKSHQDRSFGLVLLAFVTLKLLTENLGQGISATEKMIGGHVLVEAHLYGAIIGIIFAVIKIIKEKLYS